MRKRLSLVLLARTTSAPTPAPSGRDRAQVHRPACGFAFATTGD
jgi:hypothetical protein